MKRLAAACLVVPLAASAVDLEERLSARLDRDRAPTGSKLFKASEPDRPRVAAGAGVAIDEDQDSVRVSNAPVYLSVQTPGEAWWRFVIATDGYTRVRAPGSPRASGWSDVVLSVTRPLSAGTKASLIVTVPSKGEVGSSAGTQALRLSHGAALSDSVSWGVRGTVRRSDTHPAGVGRTSQSLLGSLTWAPNQAASLSVSASRSHRRGVDGRTELGLEYEMAWSPQLTGTLSLARGVTAGARHTGAGFEIGYSF